MYEAGDAIRSFLALSLILIALGRGVGFFVGAIALVYVSPLKGLLIYDVCIIIGYLIPGYMLKKELS